MQKKDPPQKKTYKKKRHLIIEIKNKMHATGKDK